MRIPASAPAASAEWRGPEQAKRAAPPKAAAPKGAAPSFAATISSAPRSTPAAPAPAALASPPHAPTPGRAFFERTIDAERKVDVLLQAAATGKTFRPGELLALQAAVFRYSQTVEVASRVADRLVGAIKQTMGTQV